MRNVYVLTSARIVTAACRNYFSVSFKSKPLPEEDIGHGNSSNNTGQVGQ
jgi:hypothetical protein